MTSTMRLLVAAIILTWLQVVAEASDQQIVYIRNTCECWSTDLKCVCKIESDPTSVRPLMQRLVNRTAEYYWQEIEFQSMVYDRTTFILANTFADGPFPSGVTFKGDFSIVNDSFNHLNMTLNKVELNFETFSGRKPKFSKQYWRYIFDHGEGTLRSLRIIKYQIEDFIIPNHLGAALTQEVRPLTEFKVTGCEVKEVKERAFKNFTQLEVLDLSDNHLTTLPENVFSRNINLQKILLANNQISFLTKTIFDGLPNLLLINLRKNKLTAVPAIPRHTNRRFQPMVYLMADNSIHCRCSLIWVLHELTFHHNLEIEATCSDPTMVRGMPIIEGFTRMDKEACYRVVRADDGLVRPVEDIKQLSPGLNVSALGQQVSVRERSNWMLYSGDPHPDFDVPEHKSAAVVGQQEQKPTAAAALAAPAFSKVSVDDYIKPDSQPLSSLLSAKAAPVNSAVVEQTAAVVPPQSDSLAASALKHVPAAAEAAVVPSGQVVNVAPQTVFTPPQSSAQTPIAAAVPAQASSSAVSYAAQVSSVQQSAVAAPAAPATATSAYYATQ